MFDDCDYCEGWCGFVVCMRGDDGVVDYWCWWMRCVCICDDAGLLRLLRWRSMFDYECVCRMFDCGVVGVVMMRGWWSWFVVTGDVWWWWWGMRVMMLATDWRCGRIGMNESAGGCEAMMSGGLVWWWVLVRIAMDYDWWLTLLNIIWVYDDTDWWLGMIAVDDVDGLLWMIGDDDDACDWLWLMRCYGDVCGFMMLIGYRWRGFATMMCVAVVIDVYLWLCRLCCVWLWLRLWLWSWLWLLWMISDCTDYCGGWRGIINDAVVVLYCVNWLVVMRRCYDDDCVSCMMIVDAGLLRWCVWRIVEHCVGWWWVLIRIMIVGDWRCWLYCGWLWCG